MPPTFQRRIILDGLRAILTQTWSNRDTFALVTEGTFYNTLYLFDDPGTMTTLVQFQDKLFSKQWALGHGIQCPMTYAYSDDEGKWYINRPLLPHQDYVVKPRYGSLGFGVSKQRGHVLQGWIHDHSRKNWLIEEYVQDTTYSNGPRHYRVITLFRGDVFDIVQFSGTSPAKIASNYAQGGQSVHVDWESSKVPLEFKKMIRSLCRAHQRHLPAIVSIGWDVMLQNGTTPLLLEGNVGHAALFHTTSPEKIRYYRALIRPFYDNDETIDC